LVLFRLLLKFLYRLSMLILCHCPIVCLKKLWVIFLGIWNYFIFIRKTAAHKLVLALLLLYIYSSRENFMLKNCIIEKTRFSSSYTYLFLLLSKLVFCLDKIQSTRISLSHPGKSKVNILSSLLVSLCSG